MNAVEKALFEKTKDFQEGEIYSDQWKFAKSYLPKVLDTISHVFPHYSLHNSTHSESIINNIVRIIGEESVKKLSVVDLWLLLASAYYHDCGMIVTGNDKIDIFKEGSEFVKFVEEKQKDTFSSLNQYAILFDVKDNKIYYKNEQLTKESYEGARFLLADFIRTKHAERSGSRIEKEGSLHFPGDPIPERIIRILKDICSCHTKDVKEVMDLQPIESSGCGTEDCHPRFVAAMLRLGDLLDVDSNRVSEVLLSTLGSIPSDSKFYNKTNRSITHIRIDQSVIEITAECDDYYVADLINRWFQWLNDELVFYMKRWHKIIPSNDFGYLPTVGDLKVNLTNYDTFDGKKRPGFEIDSSRAIELLQGSGLYTDSCECIRELLQNAVDATYLRVYKENPGIRDLQTFREKCSKYPISVTLDKMEKQFAQEGDVSWRIKIDDQGIGMTKNDLKFLSMTGSSGRNAEKHKLIQSVPEFLWPSGTFGIGFQSVFLITDRVSIVSRKLNKDHYLRAEMHNPAGKEKGAILIQSINKEEVPYGTSLSFEFQDKKGRPQLFHPEDRYSISEFCTYDFAKSKTANFMGMRVMDEVARFANGTFIPVDFYLNGEKKKYVYEKTRIDFDGMDEDTGMQVFVEKPSTSFDDDDDDTKVYYRNQIVRDYYLHLPFLKFHVNILKGSAKDILTLDRNRIKSDYVPTLRKNIIRTLILYLNREIDTFDIERRQLASMFLEINRPFINENKINGIVYKDYWKKYEIRLKKEGSDGVFSLSLEKLLAADFIERLNREDESDLVFFVLDSIRYSISSEYEMWYSFNKFIMTVAKNKGYSLRFTKSGYILSKEECDVLDDSKELREELLYQYLILGDQARGFFPCNAKYSALLVNRNSFASVHDYFASYDYPCMVCPFIRVYDLDQSDDPIGLDYDVDEKVINTVFDNRISTSVTKNQIRKAYSAFKKEWAPIVKTVNERVKKDSRSHYRTRRISYIM